MTITNGSSTPSPQRTSPWLLRALSIGVSLLAVAIVDVVIGAAGLRPPADPALLSPVGPFVSPLEEVDDRVQIRAGWVNDGLTYQFTEGKDEGRYFLHPGFRSTTFARTKAADGIRVFVLGGSTTFGLMVGREKCYAGLLDVALRKAVDGARRTEVINLGSPGWGSTQVAQLSDVVLEYDADLIVIESGHNEMLSSTVTTPSVTFLAALRRRLIDASALGDWLDYALRSARSDSARVRVVAEDSVDLSEGRVAVTSRSDRVQPLPDRSFREASAERFGANLRSILTRASVKGVPVVFVAPVSNLLWPPGGSGFAAGFRSQAEVIAAVDEAVTVAQGGDFARAHELLTDAVDRAPEFAEAWYDLGLVRLWMKRVDEARLALREARDRDAWTHRMTTPLETRLEEIAHRAGVPLVDVRPDFESELDSSSIDRLFLDHVHPTEEGHRMIAEALWPVVRRVVPVGQPIPSR